MRLATSFQLIFFVWRHIRFS